MATLLQNAPAWEKSAARSREDHRDYLSYFHNGWNSYSQRRGIQIRVAAREKHGDPSAPVTGMLGSPSLPLRSADYTYRLTTMNCRERFSVISMLLWKFTEPSGRDM